MKLWRLGSVALLALSVRCAVGAEEPLPIVCEGTNYPWHVQGVATDGTNVYWSYTTVIVKTDLAGRMLGRFDVSAKMEDGHLGDLACRNGRVYVGVNRGRGGKDRVRRGDEVWMLNPVSMTVERKYPTPEVCWDNNGLDWWDGSWWVVTSAPRHFQYNLLFEYTEDFRFRYCHVVKSGWTHAGVQTILTVGDRLLLGAYGKPNLVIVDAKALRLDKRRDVEDNTAVERLVDDCYVAEGMLSLNGTVYGVVQMRYSAQGEKPQRWGAKLVPLKQLTDSLATPSA